MLRFTQRLIAVVTITIGWTISAAAAPPLVLDDASSTIDAWQTVTTLSDPSHKWTVQDVISRLSAFEVPDSPYANLGVRREAVWLRIPVVVPSSQSGSWLLNIDYPLLQRVDVHVISNGEPIEHVVLGNMLLFSQRPLPTRTPTMSLALKPGHAYELLIRIVTSGSLLLPISFIKSETFHVREVRVQMLLGLTTGIGLCLLLYSLAQWVSLRDPMFLSYALATLGSTVFFFAYFGLGPQHAWPESAWLTSNGAVLAAHVGSLGGALFIDRVLAVGDWSRLTSIGLRTVAVFYIVIIIGFIIGVIDYRAAQLLATILGPVPMLLAVPAAYVRMRNGDRAASYILVGWSIYVLGILILVGLLHGRLPTRFWSVHAFQISALLEMVMWMRVLGVRMEAIRSSAQRASVERDMLHSLAYTDPLTSLPNRRGLNEALRNALPNCATGRIVSIYLLDLDGFKAINDSMGHDAGDELLVLVARRLQTLLRTSDLVARLGGDEFVILASGLPGDSEAQMLGRKVLESFAEPFLVSGQICKIGLTMGYALAPLDGRDAASLLKRADAAMYVGKQAGKNCIRRGGASSSMAIA